ncbi:MAG: hypothetical protein CVU89_08990 [Firmicutes bacterium HGW-Firmicutes-14]|nr:MAG: hypothetical protein CVU89_08990 [Firmicutes bacterium HGW-Firmicutes-14]
MRNLLGNELKGRMSMTVPALKVIHNKNQDNCRLIFLIGLLMAGILAVGWVPGLFRIIDVPVFLTLHVILEFLSVVVSIAVFIVAWYNYKQTRSMYELVICLTFLSVGIIDFAHTLSYNGMPDFFTPNSVDKASAYWIIGRLVQAAGILLAVFYSTKSRIKINAVMHLVVTIALTSAALVFIAADVEILPHMYREGYGQTRSKVVLEYVVIFLEAVSLLYLFVKGTNAQNAEYSSAGYLKAALVFSIFSEVAFTLYASAYDSYNLIGHIYKIGAFACILRGLFVVSLVNLYETNKVLREQKEKLAEINGQLAMVNRLKSEFLANTNHELRTPLTAIVAFAEILMDGETGPLNSTQRDYLAEINESSQRLLVEINNLLDMSKLEAGQMKVYPEMSSLDEAVSQVLRQMKPLFQQKSQQVIVSLDDNLPSILMDREKTKKVLVNLLSNANKFSPQEGEISLEAVLSDDRKSVLVCVRDDGPGLAEDQAEQVFNKFYQAEGPLMHSLSGTGIGLSLVRHFVELQGGSIWVDSQPGQGCAFCFSLPVKSGDKEAV